MRLLIVEDERKLAEAMCDHLRAAGDTVDLCETLEDAQSAIATTAFDLILLDLGLPDGDGLAFLTALRAAGNTVPTLIVTAREQIRNRIAGLKAGADDYVVKPIDLDELSARIEAIARRASPSHARPITVGNIKVFLQERQVQREDISVALTRREWALLECLTRRRNQIVETQTLVDALYSFDEQIESNAIAVHINRLRAKLGKETIITHRGIGYGLAQTV